MNLFHRLTRHFTHPLEHIPGFDALTRPLQQMTQLLQAQLPVLELAASLTPGGAMLGRSMPCLMLGAQTFFDQLPSFISGVQTGLNLTQNLMHGMQHPAMFLPPLGIYHPMSFATMTQENNNQEIEKNIYGNNYNPNHAYSNAFANAFTSRLQSTGINPFLLNMMQQMAVTQARIIR